MSFRLLPFFSILLACGFLPEVCLAWACALRVILTSTLKNILLYRQSIFELLKMSLKLSRNETLPFAIFESSVIHFVFSSRSSKILLSVISSSIRSTNAAKPTLSCVHLFARLLSKFGINCCLRVLLDHAIFQKKLKTIAVYAKFGG